MCVCPFISVAYPYDMCSGFPTSPNVEEPVSFLKSIFSQHSGLLSRFRFAPLFWSHRHLIRFPPSVPALPPPSAATAEKGRREAAHRGGGSAEDQGLHGEQGRGHAQGLDPRADLGGEEF